MRIVQPNRPERRKEVPFPEDFPEEVTERDEERFLEIVRTELDEDQVARILKPPKIYPDQKDVLAIHWHPEFIPMDLVMRRMAATFPGRERELIIPTQHNIPLVLDGFAGVEVDCYSAGFNQKVQLLLHMPEESLRRGHVLRSMLAHTFRYRSSQLDRFIDTLVRPVEERLEQAAAETGADETLVRFVRIQARKVRSILDRRRDEIPPEMIKNRLMRDFLDTLVPDYGIAFIRRAQTFLQAVKQIVKAHFPLHYFYETSEIIAEARALGAGIVIPHPEQFWPILLAEYDVDGLEVWNPQSRRYTEFLLSVVIRRNERTSPSGRRLLIFMGDDTHFSEKAKEPELQDREKAAREIGVQPAWEDLNIRKKLLQARMDRRDVIEEYRARLAG